MNAKSNLIKGTIMLTIFGFLGKAMGALFKIGLVNIIGAKGMGIYGLIFFLFVFFTLLSSEGFSLGLTMNIAKNNNGKMVSYKKEAFRAIFSLSIISAIMLVFLSPILSSIQGGVVGWQVYVVVALCVVAVAMLGYFKAIIRGREAFKLFSIIEVVEDIFKIAIGLVFAKLFMRFGEQASVVGIFLGVLFSALVSIIVVLFFGKKYLKNSTLVVPLTKDERRAYYKFSGLTMACDLVVPVVQFIDSILVIHLLGFVGLFPEQATSLFGISKGSVAAILNLPTFLLVAFEFLLLPLQAKAVSESDYTKKTTLSLMLAFFVSVPFVVFFNVFSMNIITLLYGSALTEAEILLAANLLKLGSISIIFSALTSVMVVGLEAKEVASVPLVATVLGGVVKIVFMIIFVPKISIYAVELSSVLFCLVECLVVFIYAKKHKLFNRPKYFWWMSLGWLALVFLMKGIYALLTKLLPLSLAFILSGALTLLIASFVVLILVIITKKKKINILQIVYKSV